LARKIAKVTQGQFYERHPYLYLLGFGLLIVSFFVVLNLLPLGDEEPSSPRISDSDRQQQCLESIPLDYPQSMYDNAVENCLMIGSND
jgi:hypothetical protein